VMDVLLDAAQGRVIVFGDDSDLHGAATLRALHGPGQRGRPAGGLDW
jgi:hypothetical protein